MKKKPEETNTFKVKKVAEFECAIYENAQNIALALAKAGRCVNISGQNSHYLTTVYEFVR